MTDEPYTNLDLDTAEQLLITAGRPELAVALRYQAQGVRNLVQGEWGRSFIASLEGLLITHIAPLLTAQKETQDAVSALGGRFQTVERDVKSLAARLDHKRIEIDQIKQQQITLALEQVALAARLTRLEARGDG